MPKINTRPCGLSGLGDLSAFPSALGGRWQDADKVRITDQDTLGPWPGWRRRGVRLFDTDRHGAAADTLQVVRFPESYLDETAGHGIAVVDRSTNTAGRVLAVHHHRNGARGAQLIGEPDVSGIETGGYFTGSTVRVMMLEIISEGTPDVFKWSQDGGSTWYLGGEGAGAVNVTGDWQTIGSEGVKIKFGATTGHTTGDQWIFVAGGESMLAATLNRQCPHQYPQIRTLNGKSYIFDPWNPVYVDDGRKVRRAGLEQPKIRPQLLSTNAAKGLTGNVDANPVAWVSAHSSVTVTRNTASPAPAVSSACVKLALSSNLAGQRDTNLAYLDTTGVLAAGITRMTAWVYLESDDNDFIGATFELYFAEKTALTGGYVRAQPNDALIPTNQWVQVSFRLPGAGAFIYRSFGIRTHYPINQSRFTNGGSMSLLLDQVKVDAPETDSVDLWNIEGEWAFCFTWYDSERDLESAPSPYTPTQNLASMIPELDLSGYYAGIDAGLINSAPDGADAVHIYAANTLWDVDPRTGGLSFYRITDDAGLAISTIQARGLKPTVTKSTTNTGNGTFSAIVVDAAAIPQTWRLVFSDATNFSVTGSVTGASDAGTVGSEYDNDQVSFTITAGGEAFVSGDTFNFEVYEGVPSLTASTPAADSGNTGNGTMGAVTVTGQSYPADIAVAFYNPTLFKVTDSVRGVAGSGVVGTEFDNGKYTFTITAGGVAFVSGDQFTFSISQGSGILTASTPSAGGTTIGNGTVEDIDPVAVSAEETITVALTSSTAFSVTSTTQGALDAGTVNEEYDATTCTFTVVPGSTPFVAGDVFQFTLTAAGTKLPVVLDGDLAISVETTPTSGPRQPFYNGEALGGEIAIEDGRVLVTARRPAYRVGTWTKTNESHVIAPVDSGATATTPVCNDWMVGRQCRFLGDDQTYVIVKQVTGGLWIADDWNAEDQQWDTAYQGATGSGVLEILADNNSITWTNNTSERGVDGETMSVFNRLDVLSGDEILGGGKADEWVWLVGRRGAVVLRQDAGSLADQTSTPMYSNPIHVDGTGILGPRCWVSLPDGSAMFLSHRGELVQVRGSAAVIHPASESLAPVLSGYGLLARTGDLVHSHLSYHQTRDGACLFLGLIGPGASSTGQAGLRPRMATQWDLSNPSRTDTEPGDSVQVSALTRDFEIGLWVDLRRGLVYPATECRFSVVDKSHCGDRDGFLGDIFNEEWLSWGSPNEEFIYSVTAGGENTATVDGTLTASTLIGLLVAKVTGTTVEYRRVSSNTADTIAVSENWTAEPTTADLLIVGPLAWMLHLSEIRQARPFCLVSLMGDYDSGQVVTVSGTGTDADTLITLETFISDDTDRHVSDLTADASRTVTGSTLEGGIGKISLSPLSAKAQSLRLTVLGGQKGPARLRGLGLEERVR